MSFKQTVDRVIAFGAAVAAPVLTFTVDQHWLTAMQATDVGGIVAAAVGAYHGGAVIQGRTTAAADLAFGRHTTVALTTVAETPPPPLAPAAGVAPLTSVPYPAPTPAGPSNPTYQ